MQAVSLYRFLNLIGGTWRNAAYIECGICPYNQPNCGDHLLAIDYDGTPVLYSVKHFCRETGESVDKAECAIVLRYSVFEQLYSRWIIWHLPKSYYCSIQQLTPQPNLNTTALEVFK